MRSLQGNERENVTIDRSIYYKALLGVLLLSYHRQVLLSRLRANVH
jgi:hypothetical protein